MTQRGLPRPKLWATAAIALLGLTVSLSSFPKLYYLSLSASAPRGLYYLDKKAPLEPGAWLLLDQKWLLKTLGKRPYLKRPLLKQYLGSTGSRICRFGSRVYLGSVPFGPVFESDSAGLSLPAFLGCNAAGPAELIVLARSSHSFDSRYFGPVSESHVLDRMKLVFSFDN